MRDYPISILATNSNSNWFAAKGRGTHHIIITCVVRSTNRKPQSLARKITTRGHRKLLCDIEAFQTSSLSYETLRDLMSWKSRHLEVHLDRLKAADSPMGMIQSCSIKGC